MKAQRIVLGLVLSSIFAIPASITWPLSLQASEGVWLPHKLAEGVNFWDEKDKVGNVDSFVKSTEQLYQKVVKIGACSGAFVGKNGLLVTQYHCTRSLLQWHSTPEKNLAESGFLAKYPSEELKAEDGPSVVVTHQVADVSADITKGLKGFKASHQLAMVDKRIKSRVAACKKKSAYSCRIVEVVPGSQYVELQEEVLNDLRLVFVPSEAEALGNQDPFQLKFGNEIAPFAFMRLYKEGRPYQVEDPVVFDPKPQLSMGLPIMTVGYTNIYKRYLTVAYGHALFENGMMKPVTDMLHRALPFQAKKMQDDKKVGFEYKHQYQSLLEWSERIGREHEVYAAMKYKAKKVDPERDYINHVAKDDPKAVKEFEAYSANTREFLFQLRHANRFDNFSLASSMKLVDAVLKQVKEKTFIRRAWLERKVSSLNLDVEQHFLVSAAQVFAEFPYPSYGQSQNLQIILNGSEDDLKHHFRDTLQKSFVFRVLPSDREVFGEKELDLADDPLVKLYKEIRSFESAYGEEALRKQSRLLEFGYLPRLERYHREKNIPFYPNIGMNLPGFALGKVRGSLSDESGSLWDNFNTDIDGCFRDLKGAPVFDTKGRLLGIYITISYRGPHDVNFYYDPERTDTINLSSQRIRESLVKHGASRLLDELLGGI